METARRKKRENNLSSEKMAARTLEERDADGKKEAKGASSAKSGRDCRAEEAEVPGGTVQSRRAFVGKERRKNG